MNVVYLVQPVDGGPVRVGTSGDIASRAINLGAWHPHGVEVIATFPGSFAREAMVHRLLRSQALGRDWFRSSPIVWRFILDVVDGRIDWLPEEPVIVDSKAIHEEIRKRINSAFGSRREMALQTRYSLTSIGAACSDKHWNPSARLLSAVLLKEADLRGDVPAYLQPLWSAPTPDPLPVPA